jgi:hypothetical protein
VPTTEGLQAWLDAYVDVMRFDGDGRCTEFVEWFMEQPRD